MSVDEQAELWSKLERVGGVAEDIPPGFVDVRVSGDCAGTLCLGPGFTTVRACLDCGVLIAGGPTRCLLCAREMTPVQRAEPVAQGVDSRELKHIYEAASLLRCLELQGAWYGFENAQQCNRFDKWREADRRLTSYGFEEPVVQGVERARAEELERYFTSEAGRLTRAGCTENEHTAGEAMLHAAHKLRLLLAEPEAQGGAK